MVHIWCVVWHGVVFFECYMHLMRVKTRWLAFISSDQGLLCILFQVNWAVFWRLGKELQILSCRFWFLGEMVNDVLLLLFPGGHCWMSVQEHLSGWIWKATHCYLNHIFPQMFPVSKASLISCCSPKRYNTKAICSYLFRPRRQIFFAKGLNWMNFHKRKPLLYLRLEMSI